MNDPRAMMDENLSDVAPRAQLRALLEERLEANDSAPGRFADSHLISIRACDDSLPLVCVLGGGAGVPTYRRLSELMPGQTMFALQRHAPSSQGVMVETIEEMAQAHAACLQRQLPRGPYFFCGHSMGATIAFELAQQVRRAGGAVAGLFIIDQPGPDVKVTCRDWWYWQWAAISHLPWRMRWNYVRDGLMYRLRTTRRLPESCRRWFFRNDGTRQVGASGPRLSANEYRRRATDASIHALQSYRPQPCDFPCVLIRAESGAPRIHADRHGGWGHVSQGQITVIDVAGTHMDMFRDYRLQAVADIFADVIGDASRDPAS